MNITSSTNHPKSRHTLVHSNHHQKLTQKVDSIPNFDESRVDLKTDKNVPKISTKGGVKAPFPVKLMELLNHIDQEEPGLADIVSWQPNGKYFKVHDKETFEKLVQPRFFAQTSYTSFRRQLNLWNFKRVKRDSISQDAEDKSDDIGSYHHSDFVRDDPYRCRLMRKPRDSKASPSKSRNRRIMKTIEGLSPCPQLDESASVSYQCIPPAPSLSWSESTESEGSLNAYSTCTNHSSNSNKWASQGYVLYSRPSHHHFYKDPNCCAPSHGLDFMMQDIEPIEDLGEALPMTSKTVALYLKEVLGGLDN